MNTIKFLLASLSLLLYSSVSVNAQALEVESSSTAGMPNIKITETSMNNFTRLMFTNANTTNEWILSTKAFTGGLANNTFNINSYDGTGTISYLKMDSDDELITLTKDVQTNDRLFVNDIPTALNNTQFRVYTEDQNYSGVFHNDKISNALTYGAYAYAVGTGSGARIGIYGQSIADTGSARGVSGIANSASGNEYGVYGEASGASGSSWGIYSNGDFYYTGAFMAPSDKRLKKNIASLSTGVLAKVLLLNAKTYEYDQEIYPSMNFAKGPQIGFLAQDLQALFPELVVEQRHSVFEIPGDVNSKESEIEILGVDYIKMIPILTAAIQEQNEIIEQLRNEIIEIKASLNE